ncbi:MAG: hypothetical protein NZM40_05680 [Sphingomonadaceae bacterium]|uniref:hypothetical protein n=1 Tax=Thermaurantiacus sp. TaxID=2820283 RepID=UPI00298EE3B5|nr:hypothetical protein [Thermaurantiacus sp.]MCS6986908.1 hypothetical protein [Sphingomonadaceae bacterium]MDW8415492.1 hypothetical protein [Thermaurantiacus sp.]
MDRIRAGLVGLALVALVTLLGSLAYRPGPQPARPGLDRALAAPAAPPSGVPSPLV